MEKKHLGLRIEDTLHWKLRYIADYEGRSINEQVRYSILEYVRTFERTHGPIPQLDDDK